MMSFFSATTSHSSEATAIRTEQVKMLYRGLLSSIPASVIIAIVIIFIQRQVIETNTLVWWFIAFLIVQCLRASTSYLYFKKRLVQFGPDDWYRLFVLGTLLTAMVWGSAAWFLYPPDSIAHQAFLGMIAAGLTAGAVTSLSASLPMIILFILVALSPLTVRFLFSSNDLTIALGGLTLLFQLGVLLGARQINHSIIQNMELRFQGLDRENKLKQSEQALYKAQQKAEQASEAKSQFLATVSHEVRTPMNGILGMSELLEESELDSAQREYLTIIRSSGKDLLVIIDDILDFSKIEAGQLMLDPLPIDIKESCNEVIKRFSKPAKEKQIQLSFDFPEEIPPYVMGDAARIHQVLSNLIANAIKFTEQGSVSIKISSQGFDKECISLTFNIIDTGIGINPMLKDSLFDAFTQADSSTTRHYGGTGLGLAIAKKLVLLMQGSIGVESTLGQGSNFWFTLSLARVQDPYLEQAELGAKVEVIEKNQPNEKEESAGSNAIRILLVEDLPSNQCVTTAVLEHLGFDYDLADNGEIALQQFQKNHYDLILMDCQMPVMDGLEATQKIRAMELGKPRTPIIALTANAMESDRQKCLEVGMDDFISKPFDLVNLEQKIKTWLIEEAKPTQFE